MISHDVSLNALWCRCIAEELRRAGTGFVVLCPGSRNSPLLHALHAQFDTQHLVHIDERSAAFIALGAAKASGKPAAICVTSGSAVANLMPALSEAHAAHIPLILVTADRPWELHGNGAPQAMPQAGIFSQFVTAQLDLGEPTASESTLRALRAQVSRLVQSGGPAHLNIPLRDPLAPLPDPAWPMPALSSIAMHGRDDAMPFTRCVHTVDDLQMMRGLKPGQKGLIVVGAVAVSSSAILFAICSIARRTGFPVLADAASGLRAVNVGDVPVITTADALVTGELGKIAPDLIIQIGPMPLARSLYEYLGHQDCPWMAIDGGSNQDFLAHAHAAISQPTPELLYALGEACSEGDQVWRDRWVSADVRARTRLTEIIAAEPWGEIAAVHHVLNHPGFAHLHLASSMSIRHANVHLTPGPVRPINANRGVNGIDGTIATFLGECRILGRGLLLLGDLAFLHDLPALAATHDCQGAIVIMNNDGGGIFDFLAVAQMPAYQHLVRTAHGLHFEHTAKQFALTYQAVASIPSLRQALDQAASGAGLVVIECHVAESADNPDTTVERHRRLIRLMAGAPV